MSLGELTILTNANKLAARFAPGGRFHKALGRELAQELVHGEGGAGAFERRMKRLQFAPYTGQPRKDKLQARTGRLRQSISFRTFGGHGWNISVKLRATAPYARAQEYGANIEGKPWLVFPLPWTLTKGGGQVQAKYRTYKEGGDWRTRHGLTWVERDSQGKAFIKGQIGKGKVGTLKVMVRRVTLPGPKTTGDPSRLGFKRTWLSLRRQRLIGFQHAVKRARRAKR